MSDYISRAYIEIERLSYKKIRLKRALKASSNHDEIMNIRRSLLAVKAPLKIRQRIYTATCYLEVSDNELTEFLKQQNIQFYE